MLLEEKLKNIRKEEKKILEKIDDRNKKRKIDCGACNKPHEIQSLTLIQTHWYTEPHGCNDGDSWKEGEMQFICPETKIRNRLLFDNYEIPCEERYKFENNPEEQFKSKYRSLFKEVLKEHEDSAIYNSVNNYYVDKNRKKFGLVEKK